MVVVVVVVVEVVVVLRIVVLIRTGRRLGGTWEYRRQHGIIIAAAVIALVEAFVL